jgi:hypothetical protein
MSSILHMQGDREIGAAQLLQVDISRRREIFLTRARLPMGTGRGNSSRRIFS